MSRSPGRGERVAAPLSRRGFLTASLLSGGGALLTARLSLAVSRRHGPATPDAAAEYAFSVYARVKPSGAVTLYAPNPEMGQGIKMGLPMIFAEEFGVAWSDVTLETADFLGGTVMGSQGSGGSMSTVRNWTPLRKAGAAGRQMFIAAAAQVWRVPGSECRAALSVVEHAASGRRLTYGQLAERAAAQPVPDLDSVPLKDEAAFTIIGQRLPNPDIERIVAGREPFGIDVTVPGMRYAVYQKGPVFDAEVRSANLEEIRALPGVHDAFVLKGAPRQLEGPPGHPFLVIDDGLRGGVAIVADSWWRANSARAKLRIDWDEGPHAEDSTQRFDAEAARLLMQPPERDVRVDGDPAAALAGAAQVLRARYTYPFLAHATLEPQNCLAWYRDGRIEIWAPTQNPGPGGEAVAAALGIPPGHITIHLCRCGGGFGRRLANDYMIEAAVISRQVGAPVKLIFAREDDMRHGFYRPGGYHDLTAGLDAAGRLIAWRNHFAGFTRNQYWNVIAVPAADVFPGGYLENYSLSTSRISFNVPICPYRAPGDNAHAFVFQSFLDELAHAAARDPIEFQLELLNSPLPGEGVQKPGPKATFVARRMIAVIERVRERSDWSRRGTLPRGTGLGFAWYWSHLGYVAQVHQVRVGPDHEVALQKVWVVLDVGRHIINPPAAEHQVVGAVLDGLSAAFFQKITFEKGRVVESNFNDYRLMRNTNIPVIDQEFLRTDNEPTGLGEPALPSAVAACCNAIFAASGRRIRSLPIAQAMAASIGA